MKKTILRLLTIAITSSFSANAQPLPIGSTVKDISFTDIKGNKISLYGYLDQGYTVLVDISATWCGPCWSFEQTGTGQRLYEQYGPEGTVNPGKIVFLFIEGDPGTGANDLLKKGSKSQGDWVTGKTHPIVDAPDWEAVKHFSVPGTTQIGFPTFLLICPDRKVTWNGSGFSANWNESFFAGETGACGTGVTGIEDALVTLSAAVYPNPVTDLLHLDLNVKERTTTTLTISNMLGQEVMREQVTLLPGLQTHTVAAAGLAKGLYIVSLTNSDHSHVAHKFLKR